MLKKLSGYETEARDAARASMGQPAWTIAATKNEMDEVAKFNSGNFEFLPLVVALQNLKKFTIIIIKVL